MLGRMFQITSKNIIDVTSDYILNNKYNNNKYNMR